ncbi:hypothetical protein LTR28_007236, partial [Elasticomyces elasticus]
SQAFAGAESQAQGSVCGGGGARGSSEQTSEERTPKKLGNKQKELQQLQHQLTPDPPHNGEAEAEAYGDARADRETKADGNAGADRGDEGNSEPQLQRRHTRSFEETSVA